MLIKLLLYVIENIGSFCSWHQPSSGRSPPANDCRLQFACTGLIKLCHCCSIKYLCAYCTLCQHTAHCTRTPFLRMVFIIHHDAVAIHGLCYLLHLLRRCGPSSFNHSHRYCPRKHKKGKMDSKWPHRRVDLYLNCSSGHSSPPPPFPPQINPSTTTMWADDVRSAHSFH